MRLHIVPVEASKCKIQIIFNRLVQDKDNGETGEFCWGGWRLKAPLHERQLADNESTNCITNNKWIIQWILIRTRWDVSLHNVPEGLYVRTYINDISDSIQNVLLSSHFIDQHDFTICSWMFQYVLAVVIRFNFYDLMLGCGVNEMNVWKWNEWGIKPNNIINNYHV